MIRFVCLRCKADRPLSAGNAGVVVAVGAACDSPAISSVVAMNAFASLLADLCMVYGFRSGAVSPV